MSVLNWARVGIYTFASDVRSAHYVETLEGFGIDAVPVQQLNDETLRQLDVLLLCGSGEIPVVDAQTIARWVALGGKLVCSGSTFGLGPALGLKSGGEKRPYGELKPGSESALWPEDVDRIKFYAARLFEPGECAVVATIDDAFVGASKFVLGRGATYYLAPHLGRTIDAIQLGRSVETDAFDANYAGDEDLLLAEDGATLSLDSDRRTNEDCKTPFFDVPHADALRELWARLILDALAMTSKAFVVLWRWPKNAAATAMATIEATPGEAEHIKLIAKIATGLQAKATFLSTSPGFSTDVYRALRGSFHDVGVSLKASESNDWESDTMKVQRLSILRASGQDVVAAMRPENGQWFRYKTVYESLAPFGPVMSVSKGGRTPSSQGFLFGGCTPFRPLDAQGAALDVFEFPYLAFLPGFPDGAAEALIQSTKARHGCFHFAADWRIAADAATAASFQRILALCKQERMRFITASEAMEFELARREIRTQIKPEYNFTEIGLTTSRNFEGLTLLFGGMIEPSLSIDGGPLNAEIVVRYGRKFWAATVELTAKRPAQLRVDDLGRAA